MCGERHPVALTEPTRAAVATYFTGVVERALRRRIELEPWDLEQEKSDRPIDFALVPEEVWKASKFERSYTTSRGSAWEEIAVLIAADNFGHAERNSRYVGELYQGQLTQIQRILNELESRARAPDWDDELASVLDSEAGDLVQVTVVADVHVWDDHGHREFFEVKAPRPNSDQTKVSKEKMLKLSAMLGRTCAYYALPYNPYGTRAAYRHAPPGRWFNMRADEVVLMGDDFWDRLGGSGTLDEVFEILEAVGAPLRERIRRDYLGLD